MSTIQKIINRAYRLKDRVIVVGQVDNNYVLHFNDSNDLHFIWLRSPWSLEKALMVVDVWRPKTVLNNVNLPMTLIWVQLWGLPLEY